MASIVHKSSPGPDTEQVLSDNHPCPGIDDLLAPERWTLTTTAPPCGLVWWTLGGLGLA